MSNLRVIDYRTKQKLLYVDKASPATLQNHGDSFLEEGLFSDALDFYQQAGFERGLQKIKDIAMEKGDVMLFQQAAKVLHLELKSSDWESIGQKALEAKKYYFARHAFKKANHEEMLNYIKKILQEVDSKSA